MKTILICFGPIYMRPSSHMYNKNRRDIIKLPVGNNTPSRFLEKNRVESQSHIIRVLHFGANPSWPAKQLKTRR